MNESKRRRKFGGPGKSGRRPQNGMPRRSRRGNSSNNNNRNGPRPPRLQRNEVIERGIPGFRALRYRCRLNYYDNPSVSTGGGGAGAYVYSCNGLYDPDITGTGHQPMPFDQMMLSFDHYCVMRARITVNFRNTSTTSSIGVGISINSTNTPTTNYQYLIENGEMVRDRLLPSPYDGSCRTLVLPMNVSKFSGVPTPLDNPDLWGTVAANPAEQQFFQLSFWNPDGVTVAGPVICEVFIEYDSWFLEPRKNSSSLNATLKRLILKEAEDRLVSEAIIVEEKHSGSALPPPNTAGCRAQ